MLHAEDDKIVPSHLSEKMLQTAKNNHKVLDIELVLFPSDLNLRHKYIYNTDKVSYQFSSKYVLIYNFFHKHYTKNKPADLILQTVYHIK